MNRTEKGQSLVETVILNAMIVAGMVVIWTICQERVEEYIHSLLNLVIKPAP